MFSPTNSVTIIRNYFILAIIVMITSMSLFDIFHHSARTVKKDHLYSYGRILRVGIVAQAKRFAR